VAQLKTGWVKLAKILAGGC